MRQIRHGIHKALESKDRELDHLAEGSWNDIVRDAATFDVGDVVEYRDDKFARRAVNA